MFLLEEETGIIKAFEGSRGERNAGHPPAAPGAPRRHREVYRKNSLRLRSGASGANSARSRTAAPGRLSKALVTHSHVVSHTWSIVSHFRFSRLFFFFFFKLRTLSVHAEKAVPPLKSDGECETRSCGRQNSGAARLPSLGVCTRHRPLPLNARL